MSKTPPNTVVNSGAESGDVLVGFHKSGNRGLLIEVFDAQPRGEGGRVRGAFRILHEGTGKYSAGIRAVIDRTRYFTSADEFIRLVSREPGCRDCTHGLNLNALWKLDVSAIYDCIIDVEDQQTLVLPAVSARVRRCHSCGKIYEDLTLNFCLEDGTPLDSEPAEVETVVVRKRDSNDDPWTVPRRSRKSTRSRNPDYDYIREAVNSHPNLDLTVHPGFNHKISKDGHVGSIWICPRHGGVSISATGQAAPSLYREMERLLGPHHREDVKGYKYFQANEPSDVARVIETWSSL